jgi:tetratricopeptide (TPR) repeat protein
MPQEPEELTEPTSSQHAQGSYIAQAQGGSTATVSVYNYNLPPPQPVDEAILAKASTLLSQLPLDTIPPVSPLPPGSRMPLTTNPLFVGREQEFMALAKALRGANAASGSADSANVGRIAVVTGIGGMGKTQFAAEFVHRYGRYFQGGVFWLSFAKAEGVPAEVAASAGSDLLDWRPDYHTLPLDEQVRLVLSAWQSALPRLLVFDNCEEQALIAHWRPPTGGCSVLVTSRREHWEPTLGVQRVPLEVFPRARSVELLHKYRLDFPVAEPNFDAIAEELGDLPLALHLAGSYLNTYKDASFGTPAAYLDHLRQGPILHHPSLEGEGSEYSPTSHALNVALTFDLSFRRLDLAETIDGLALRLLQRASYFAWGVPVRRDLLLATLALPKDDFAAQLQAEKALSCLVGLGLLETETEGALRIHRLLAMFVRDVAAGSNTDTSTNANVEAQTDVEGMMLKVARQLNSTGYPAPLLALQPHLRAITDAAKGREDNRAAVLCSELGYHLRMAGDYQAALPLYERALAIREKVLGPDHPNTAQSLNNLAALLQYQGDYQAALPYFKRALAIREKVLGPNHPDTAQSLNNLAGLLRDQGDYQAALPLYERALAIREKVLGPDHPNTATSLNDLAGLLQDQHDYQAALPLYERALAIWEKVLGPDHPDTATSLNNLALLLKQQGDYQAALLLYERALAIREKVLEPDHPNTATSLNNLASLLQDQHDYQAALPLYERALAIREKVLGPDHPDTATSLNNLALLLKQQGDYQAALLLYERALAIREKVLGSDHPDTATSLNNLASLLRDQADYHKAAQVMGRALSILEAKLGPDHPRTQTARKNMQALEEAIAQQR